MASEAAIEALRATLDLVSQTKMGQLFKLSDLLSRLQVPSLFFLDKCRLLFDSKRLKKTHFDPSEESLLFTFLNKRQESMLLEDRRQY